MFMMTTVTACHSTPTEDSKIEIMNEKDIVKAVKNNNLQSVKNLLESGEDVNSIDSSKRSLLLIATNNSNIEIAKLLVKHGADVNQQADNQDSAFLYAGASGQTELVKLYLVHGARFDLFNRYNGTALIPACERGHVETVRLLANTKDYPIDHVNRLGWTALMEAVVLGDGSKKYQEIVQILKDAGANLQIPDSNGVTALQHAKNKNFNEIVKILSQ